MEVYDLDDPNTPTYLANISTRGFVQPDDNAMIGGFIISEGGQTGQVVVRAIGPSLTTISDALRDPTLNVYNAQGAIVAQNEDWAERMATPSRRPGSRQRSIGVGGAGRPFAGRLHRDRAGQGDQLGRRLRGSLLSPLAGIRAELVRIFSIILDISSAVRDKLLLLHPCRRFRALLVECGLRRSPARSLFAGAHNSPLPERTGHAATLLQSGKVLITGGANESATLKSALLYDPVANIFTAAGAMIAARTDHTSTLLHGWPRFDHWRW